MLIMAPLPPPLSVLLEFGFRSCKKAMLQHDRYDHEEYENRYAECKTSTQESE